ncbi:MAG: ATP-binding protein [Steroidobacteraceae bacterium]
MRVLLFQIFRELRFNVAKHADANSAVVTLGEADGELRFSVSDRGNGFDVAAALRRQDSGASLGLRNARERIGLLGGHMQVESQAGHGTRIVLRVPKSATIGHQPS